MPSSSENPCHVGLTRNDVREFAFHRLTSAHDVDAVRTRCDLLLGDRWLAEILPFDHDITGRPLGRGADIDGAWIRQREIERLAGRAVDPNRLPQQEV